MSIVNRANQHEMSLFVVMTSICHKTWIIILIPLRKLLANRLRLLQRRKEIVERGRRACPQNARRLATRAKIELVSNRNVCVVVDEFRNCAGLG